MHPFAALFANAYFWRELVHMYFAGYIVAGFLIASVYAWAMLRGAARRYERTALVIPLTAAALAAPVQVVVGDWAARDVAQAQPVKLAAMEGLATTSGRGRAPAGLVQRAREVVRDRDPAAALAARLPQPERHGPGPRHRPGRTGRR